MNTQSRMGRGLDALFGGANEDENDVVNISTLPIKEIVPNPNQPRQHFSPESLDELAASIKQQGIIQPLLVRPKPQSKLYEIVAGERRFRAASLAGLLEVPVYIRDLNDEEVMAAALIENIQRENLSPIEEAKALQSLRETYKITQEELSARLGKSRSAIANALRLLQLSEAAQIDLQQGHISAGHARALLSLAHDQEALENLRNKIKHENLTVREAEDAAIFYKENHCLPWDHMQAESEEKNNEQEAALESTDDTALENVQEQKQSISRRAKPEYIKQLQKKLKSHLALKTSINGDTERGRITLTYTNAEELQKILEHMGLKQD